MSKLQGLDLHFFLPLQEAYVCLAPQSWVEPEMRYSVGWLRLKEGTTELERISASGIWNSLEEAKSYAIVGLATAKANQGVNGYFIIEVDSQKIVSSELR